MSTSEKYERIIPTKENPVFTAECDAWGSIEGMYKEYEVKESDGTYCGDTFALNFADAVNELHNWIKEYEYLDELKSGFFTIRLVDGTLDKYERYNAKKVYRISVSKAKKLLK